MPDNTTGGPAFVGAVPLASVTDTTPADVIVIFHDRPEVAPSGTLKLRVADGAQLPVIVPSVPLLNVPLGLKTRSKLPVVPEELTVEL